MTVNIGLRRQLWQLDYFSEGSIPDALIGVPTSWTPDQIKQFQDYWDTEFVGDLAKRRRAKFVPGEAAAKVVQTKEPSHKDDFDEWLARIICYAFSVPPQWAVRLMNRATADNQSAQAEDEGLEPTKEWVKDLIDEIVAEEFASPDLELAWLSEDENDSSKAEAALEARVKIGAVTLNELRAGLGLVPYTNPTADRPMVLTATGYVPIEANAGDQGAGAGGNGQDVKADAPLANTSVTKAAADDPDHPGWPAGTPGGVGGQFRPKGDGEGESASDYSDNFDSGSADTANGTSRTSSQEGSQYATLESRTQTDDKGPKEPIENSNGSAASNSDNGGVVLVQDEVTPDGFTIDHVPGDPLDPQKLNKPISPDEQQKIADTLTLILNQDFGTLHVHPYENRPHRVTGAVLPPSMAGYEAFDVPGIGSASGRGDGRIVIDGGTGAMYYTNTHYRSFYRLNFNPRGE